jgi:putative transposase
LFCLAFKRGIKSQTVLPSAYTAAVLFRVLLASGEITMRKSLPPRRRRGGGVDGWQSLASRTFDRAVRPTP